MLKTIIIFIASIFIFIAVIGIFEARNISKKYFKFWRSKYICCNNKDSLLYNFDNKFNYYKS